MDLVKTVQITMIGPMRASLVACKSVLMVDHEWPIHVQLSIQLVTLSPGQ